MDYSKIRHRFLRENYLLALNMPNEGIIPFRVEAVEMVEYQYQAVSKTNEGSRNTTGTIAADTVVDASMLTMGEYNIDNALKVLNCDHIYQVFIGIKPSAIKYYLYYPTDTARRGLDVKPIFNKAPYGSIDGFTSPYNAPSEESELFIPKGIDVGFSWFNPLSSAEQVDINILVRKYLVSGLRDSELVEGILRNRVPARIASLGGLSPLVYDPRTIFGMDAIPFNATREEIDAALTA